MYNFRDEEGRVPNESKVVGKSSVQLRVTTVVQQSFYVTLGGFQFQKMTD